VPIDHHPGAAIPRVPLGRQVLVEGPELLGIGGAGRGRVAPDLRQSGGEDRIDDPRDRRAERVAGEEAPPGVAGLALALAMVARAHAPRADSGPQAVAAEEETLLEGVAVQLLAGRGAGEQVGQPDT